MNQTRDKVANEFLVASQIGDNLSIAPRVRRSYYAVDNFQLSSDLDLQSVAVCFLGNLELLFQLLELSTVAPDEFAVCCDCFANFCPCRLRIFKVNYAKCIPFSSISFVLGAVLTPFLLSG